MKWIALLLMLFYATAIHSANRKHKTHSHNLDTIDEEGLFSILHEVDFGAFYELAACHGEIFPDWIKSLWIDDTINITLRVNQDLTPDLLKYAESNPITYRELIRKLTVLIIENVTFDNDTDYYFPSGLAQLALKTIEYHNCSIKQTPASLLNLSHLEKLKLINCPCVENIPQIPKDVTSLELSNCNLRSLPRSICTHENIVVLTLYNNPDLEITSLPPNLMYLDLDDEYYYQKEASLDLFLFNHKNLKIKLKSGEYISKQAPRKPAAPVIKNTSCLPLSWSSIRDFLLQNHR